MNKIRVLNVAVVTILIFSVWVAFALVVINPYLHPYVPGYEVGKPCGWEFVALAISVLVAFYWTRRWKPPPSVIKNGIKYASISKSLLNFLWVYLVFAIVIFIFEYAKFSASFH